MNRATSQVEMPVYPRGSCGGGGINSQGMAYEVLGGMYSEHYHRAIAFKLDFMLDRGAEGALCILREMPDGSMEAIEHLYDQYSGIKNPRETVKIKVCARAEQLQLKESLDKLGNMPNGPAMVQMGMDWARVFIRGKQFYPVMYPMKKNEQGKPVMYKGELIYLNGVGYSTENTGSIIRYIEEKQEAGERRVTRLKYTGTTLDVEMYRVIPGNDCKKVYVRHFTIFEAMQSNRYGPMLRWFKQAAEKFYPLDKDLSN